MSYQESNSEAAKVARDMFLKRIERGRASGARIIQKIMEEVPEDRIARGMAAPQGWDLIAIPGFIDEEVDGVSKTAIRFYVRK